MRSATPRGRALEQHLEQLAAAEVVGLMRAPAPPAAGDGRDGWTQYARRHGLVREAPASAAETPAGSSSASDTAPRRSKYGATRVQIDGRWFDSKKEAARYQELKLLQATRAIAELECQPAFPLHVLELYRSGAPLRVTTVGTFRADFRYIDLQSGEIVVEDVKSEATKTTAYRLRKRIAEAVHGVHIREL